MIMAEEAADFRRFKMATTKYETTFTRFMLALNQQAERRNLTLQVTLIASTIVLAVATIISLFKHP